MSEIGSIDDIKTERFPILIKDNYREWIDLVEDALTSKGLWKYATGSIEEFEDSSEKEDYLRNDAEAVIFLKQAVGRDNRVYLIGIRRSKDILEKLKALNDRPIEERVQFLLSQFYGFKGLSTVDLSASRLTQL
ncbi:hypothetical protein M433DRAFT_159421 [Acidomyces richmondensis BFW]|nr:hypothetical protein M433DRAFT_159421 [Acidomyces richmondensis BFW]